MLFGGVAAVLIFSAVQQKRKQTFSRAYARARDRATAARRKRRREEVDRTALVAAEDDPAFAADRVRAEAQELFTEIQEAWDRDDREALAARVAPDLMAEWRLRLEDFASKGWHNHVAVRSSEVEYVGITNRPEDTEDRCVVRVSATLDDYVLDGAGERINHTGNTSGETYLREYWTLGKRDGRWTLLSIEQDEEGEHQLDAPMEADPAEDARLTDRARVEAAVADALPADVSPAEVDDDDAENALEKARDMSLNDQRFDPDIIEGAVRRGVAAWAEAVDGDDAAFAHLAQPALLQELLYPPSPGAGPAPGGARPGGAKGHLRGSRHRGHAGDRDRPHGARGRALRGGPQHAHARGGVEGPRHPLRRHLDAGARRLRRTCRGAIAAVRDDPPPAGVSEAAP